MKYTFKIEGLDCPVCASKLATKMAEIYGVNNVKINFLTEKLTVDADMTQEDLIDLLRNTAKSFDPAVKIEK